MCVCVYVCVCLHLQAVHKSNDSKNEATEEDSEDVENRVALRTGDSSECLTGRGGSCSNNLQESEGK